MEKHFLNILSAEDDLDDQFLIEKAIEESGIKANINFVSNGKSVLDRLTEQYGYDLPDILLLDLNMPFMDGLEVLESLRKRDDIDDLPVIIFTTTSKQEYIDQCYSLGVKSFITKPDSFAELVELVKSFAEFKCNTSLNKSATIGK